MKPKIKTLKLKAERLWKEACRRKKKKCIECGKLIYLRSTRCQSCACSKRNLSLETLRKRREGAKGKRNHFWKSGIYARKNYCIDCGKLLSQPFAKRCKSCSLKGELHHYWQGGISFKPYPLGWTKTFKEQIRYRDGYKCQLCGKPEIEAGRKLDVHHIDYDKSNLKIENLISLCHSCHTKTNGKREYWTKYFERKLDEKKEISPQEIKG